MADGTAKAKFSGWTGAITARDGYVFTSPAAAFRANGFGLYDMHGNVWEWCQDWYGPKYYKSLAGRTTDDPAGDSSEQKFRVLRGGSWYGNAGVSRAADRYWSTPVLRVSYFGFRVARTP